MTETEHEIREKDGVSLERDVLRLEELKREKFLIEQEIADIEGYLAKNVEKEFTFEDDDAQVRATVVRGTMDRFDDHLISTRYPNVWIAVTRRVIDKAKYLNAVKTGIVSTEMHRQFHTTSPKRAYVVINRHKEVVE